MAFTPASATLQLNSVGSLYHIGIGDGSRSYGYLFQNDGQQSSGMLEKSNVADKERLIQYASPNLIDRDFAFYPRVTQGDYSGGALQTIFLDATKYMDSDLDVITPSYLQLRTSWTRKTVNLATSSSFINQCIAFNNDIYFTFGETNGNVYKLNRSTLGAATSGSPIASPVLGLFTDGASLFAGTSGGLYFSTGDLALAWGVIASSLNGAAFKWWEIEQGTSGRWNYYTVRGTTQDTLYKIDMAAGRPVAPANQPQVPTGNVAIFIVDIVAYQGGIAILSTDSVAKNGWDVWYHDGVNMTRIVRVEGYQAIGMCNSLGNLYVGAQDALTNGGPVLFQVGSNGFQVVARPAVPNIYTAVQRCGQPRSSAEYVYWPVRLAMTPLGLTNAGADVGRILTYNTLTGASAYLPNMDNAEYVALWNTNPQDQTMNRMLATLGAAAAFAYQNGAGSVGTVQYQQTAYQQPAPYQASGWMVSSKMDFGTPGVPKRFRRIEINHAPLQIGESITVKAFVDQDPLRFTPTLAASPFTATVTNSTLSSTVTILPLGSDTVGRSLYYAIRLSAGTSNQTTPRVIWAACEVGGSWVWDFKLDCTSKRRDLQQRPDGQGLSGKDLYFLLRNSYENGNNVTLTLTPSLQYTCNIESLEGKNIAYADHRQQGVKADEEWLVHVVLRQVI